MTLQVFSFTVLQRDKTTRARCGRLVTAHGEIQTPVFMPVGTQGTVKTLSPSEIHEVGSQIILGNTYHLYLRPGEALLRRAGGLHRFAQWPWPILTDSGGYQVFSLAALRKIHDNGVRFQSHLDGSPHEFTPESVIRTQLALGSDIMMVLDECAPYPAEYGYLAKSLALTTRWAERCLAAWRAAEPLYGHEQALFAITQGGTHADLRRRSTEELLALDFPGYAVGGLAVGEPKAAMLEMLDLSTTLLPPEKPRYLMGVGKPEDIVNAVALGIDMFDCVIPTRSGRRGQVFTAQGPLNLNNARFKDDFSPIEAACDCYACRTHTRAYLRHLFQAQEILAMRLASLHNLRFYHRLLAAMRAAIAAGTFAEFKQDFFNRYCASPQT
ncbi:MAG: tRNA guanosine(34) transglycosylase Tgt [candidate division KSB1 bacterium]|nr:tRNA guanosine(34) transglycosylase Tgt [candidate division KSB1 bacterium]MDZ7273025.1 tRNA guanosine(34) transglycosylase Tgt [candidate division KSB1 bacterium]MDZ7285128.1 tRNA guanosine(34) transglycosylase Tgt [candidate division KSB1 bacterium]MDZ7298160.1 tRNA guanosine(34) transglycosylase Tgt [candidate division KSB1 bacterium]MDZ7306914.1 tRNA guanosine(34) transglycosylase Tgt [candidate division KSB1 bacterium]